MQVSTHDLHYSVKAAGLKLNPAVIGAVSGLFGKK
jgi:hypothetical protein